MPRLLEWSTQKEFSPARTSAREARAFVGQHLNGQAPGHLIEDVELVVSELVTNAVLHARTPLLVVIAGVPGCVRLTVHDRSRDLPVLRAPGPSDTGGRGISIVDACSSDWGTTIDADGNKSVWATFDIEAATPRAV